MAPSIQRQLEDHVSELLACRRCPRMQKPVVSGGAVVSRVLLVGQAPGIKEPQLGRPFAWTAGKTMFNWFQTYCGLDETRFRSSIYMAAVCRCFPGKNVTGGDRVPDPDEIAACSHWLNAEIGILKPSLVIAVGKLAILQFIKFGKLTEVIGQKFEVEFQGQRFELIPLPHPSGASTWHRTEPGKSLLENAMRLIRQHLALDQ